VYSRTTAGAYPLAGAVESGAVTGRAWPDHQAALQHL